MEKQRITKKAKTIAYKMNVGQCENKMRKELLQQKLAGCRRSRGFHEYK